MTDTAKIIGMAPQFVVKDVVKTAEYYRDILGFSIISYFLDPPVYAMAERNGFQIHFGKADGDRIHTNAEVRKISMDCIIWVPEIEMFFEELKLRNADIVQDIVNRGYGREFILRDCDGHTIAIVD
jgi:predicted enzyme related to lactoylglutathione lyase